MDINLKFREIIESRGLKQSYVCDKTGMSSDCISRILNGHRKITAEEFLSICEVLNIDPNVFRQSAVKTEYSSKH